jgi:DNA-binding SARP family transcriptional activator
VATVVRVRLLGGLGLWIDGRPVERSGFERPSGLRLLKLLLAIPGHAVRREEAAERLWPEGDPERSAASVRKALHFARQALDRAGAPPDLLSSDGDALRLGGRAGGASAVELDIDVDRLRAAMEAVRAQASRSGGEHGVASDIAVADLELLADLSGEELLPEDPYEEWLVPIRERLRQQVLQTLVDAGRAARSGGRPDLARRLVDRALALEPAEEAAHRLGVELFLDAGQLHAARRQLVECARALAQEYGVEPSRELVDLVAAAAASRPQAPSVARDAPIIGRRQELEAADPALDRVQAGRFGAIVYRAAAGLGKTRLLREIEGAGLAGGWRIAEVRGLESSLDGAFGSLGTGLAGMFAGALPDGIDEPGRSALLTVAPSLRERPAIAFASDAALTAGLIEAFRVLAAERPLVLAIDDLQWLDGASIADLGAAVAQLNDVPLFLGATLRDGPTAVREDVAALLADIERAGGIVATVGPMAPREIRLVLERDQPSRGLDHDLVAEIADRVGGAPLFALELLRTAIETNAVTLHGSTWQRADPKGELPVPASVARLVEARMAHLPREVRDILATAAELGDDVSLDVLVAAVVDTAIPTHAGLLDTSPVLAALDDAIGGGLIVERAGRYAFAHPLFRSALRGTVLPGARVSLHHRVARAMAAGVDPTDRAAIDAAASMGRDIVTVAGHALAAASQGLPSAVPMAVGFGFAAGSRLAQVFDHANAIDTLNRTLALWERLPAADAAAYPGTAALMQLGWSRHALRDEVGAATAFRRAAAAARSDADRAAAWQAAAWMPYEHGRFDAADEVLVHALGCISDPVARAGIEADRAWIIGRTGNWNAAYEMLALAVAAMEGSAPAPLLARSLDRLGVALRDATDAEASVPVLERALRLAIECGDARLAATVRMHLAGAFRGIGRFEAATEEIDRALATCVMTGDRYIEAVSVWIAAEIAHARGDLVAARDLRRRELLLLDVHGGNEHNQAMAHAHLAFLARQLGDLETAELEAELARSIAAHSGLGHLKPRIELALASPGWFIEDAPPRSSLPANARTSRSPAR